ncbi:hypothetical protein J6590_006051 [Homalodisca vitripennis]|nr:hypothetical protein J6590_006051 [Homalodisca vitripennis]
MIPSVNRSLSRAREDYTTRESDTPLSSSRYNAKESHIDDVVRVSTEAYQEQGRITRLESQTPRYYPGRFIFMMSVLDNLKVTWFS